MNDEDLPVEIVCDDDPLDSSRVDEFEDRRYLIDNGYLYEGYCE